MISQSDLERERYEARLKGQRDYYTALAEARDEGEAKGRAEGRQEGRLEVQMARIQSLQRWLRREVMSADQLAALSAAELDDLAARLEADMYAKLGNGS